MELDEMKQMWQQYDKVLQQNKMLNEQLVNHILNDKSKNIIRRLTGIEYLGASVCALVSLFLLSNYSAAYGSVPISLCYFISVVFILAALAFCFYKIKHLNSINIGTSTVSDTAEKIQRFRLMIIMERTISVLISPVLLVALFAVMMFWVHDVDVFEDIMLYMPRLIWGFVVAIVAMLIIYRNFYLQNIKQVMDNLKEIEQFRKE